MSQTFAEPVDQQSHRLEAEGLVDHLDRMYRAALALCGNRHDAEDLVQETYARVLRKPRFIRREEDGAYLMRALRNTWSSSMTSAHARQSVTVDPGLIELHDQNTSDPQGLALDVRTAFTAVAALSPPLRETIVAVDVMGLSYKEAARALRVRQGTIMSRLHRARDSVADALDGGEG